MRKGYILRLYPYFDIDLLVMAQDPSTKFSHICKEALKAYVRGNEYSIKRIKPSADIGRGLIAEKHRLDVCIKFDSHKDKDILDFLDNVKKGYKNMFIKNLVRCYMGGIDLTIFVRGENKYEVLLEEFSQIYVSHVVNEAGFKKDNTPDVSAECIPEQDDYISEKNKQPAFAEQKQEEKKIPVRDDEIVVTENKSESENSEAVPNAEVINNMQQIEVSEEEESKRNSVFDDFLSNTSLY